MSSRVTVVAGPARSGKTHKLLATYREALRAQAAAGRFGGTLWLSPNRRAAEQVRERVLGDGLAGCFSPGIQTFEQFARQVTAAADREIRPIDERMKRLLLEQLLREAAAKRELRHFGAIALTPGFLDLVAGFISELKRVEIWPEQFETACKQSDGFRKGARLAPRETELVALYKSYQAVLEQQQLYDKEGLFWIARQLLQDGQRAPCDKLDLVVVDGFTDFTRTQLEILDVLAERSAAMLITLPDEDSQEREDLFAKPRGTLAQLRKRHPSLRLERTARRDRPDWPALDHVEQQLFKSPRRMTPVDDHAGIEFIAASGSVAEIEELARRVKRLLVKGDESTKPARKVRPDEVTIVCRSLGECGTLVREIFTRYGIPTACEAGRPLGHSPSLTALMALLKLAVEDWPFRDLLAVLGSNYFRPGWTEAADADVPAATERTIRRMQVPSGRAALLEAIEKLAMRLPEEVGADDSALFERKEKKNKARAEALLALPLLRRLGEALDRLPSQASAAAWSEALQTLADDTGLTRSMSDATRDRLHSQPQRDFREDYAAWKTFHKALAAGDRLAQLVGGTAATVARDDLPAYLETIVAGEQLPGERDETGCVRVLSAITARTVSTPYLFVAGLTEKSFPAAESGSAMYGDAEIQKLVQAGLPLTSTGQRRRDEMLLFYESITRAERRLWLSFPALNAKAEPLLPSPYLAELARICKHDLHGHAHISDLRPVPPEDALLNIFDARIRAAAAAGDDSQGDTDELAAVVRSSEEAGANLLAGLAVVDERSRRESYGAYEGVILGEAARRALAKHFHADFPWSAGQLEQYGDCPYQFFLARVLKLEPAAEVALEVDYFKRGSRVHDVLAELHASINEQLAQAGLPREIAEVEYERLVEHTVAKYLAKNNDAALAEAFRAIDEKLLRRWLKTYRTQHQGYEVTHGAEIDIPRPAHFEASFGMPVRDGDKISKTEPLELTLHDERVVVTGRIDRIDVGLAAGRAVFTIVDYKTGRGYGYSKNAVLSGQALQLTLYAMAAEKLLLRDEAAVPWQFGYWFIAESGFKKTLLLHQVEETDVHPTEEWTQLRDRIVERVVSLVRGIRSGQFPMHSADENCTSLCEFSTACRVAQVRSLEKTWQPPPARR